MLQVCRSGKPPMNVALWSALIVLFPLVGLAAWAACGPRGTKGTTTTTATYGGTKAGVV